MLKKKQIPDMAGALNVLLSYFGESKTNVKVFRSVNLFRCSIDTRAGYFNITNK